MGIIIDAFEAGAAEIHRLRTQRDALLAACQGLIEYWDRNDATTIQIEKLADHVSAIRAASATAAVRP